ncbi:MAG: hypothetical protein FJ134_10450 [Deltaproteobacteria bacterium]|nr:hypothetical protein [Deltaproteobacteria bacterium]
MISPAEKAYILEQAYIPEHLVDLMTQVSGGEPFLWGDYFGLRGRDWTIMVGYPLSGEFLLERFGAAVREILDKFRPREVWVIAPRLPGDWEGRFSELERDHYFTLDMPAGIPRPLQRAVSKARENLTVTRTTACTEPHLTLIREFLERVNPHPRMRELYLSMPRYVGKSPSALILDAHDHEGNLTAFYVVDLAVPRFAAYIIGCRSWRHPAPYASDLLMAEMIALSQEQGKTYIHLGLGVSPGIRRFKEKWGGRPTRPYEMGRLIWRKPSIFTSLWNRGHAGSRV